jgi:hypothetical protein
MAPFGQQTYDGWLDLGLRIWGYEGLGGHDAGSTTGH